MLRDATIQGCNLHEVQCFLKLGRDPPICRVLNASQVNVKKTGSWFCFPVKGHPSVHTVMVGCLKNWSMKMPEIDEAFMEKVPSIFRLLTDFVSDSPTK